MHDLIQLDSLVAKVNMIKAKIKAYNWPLFQIKGQAKQHALEDRVRALLCFVLYIFFHIAVFSVVDNLTWVQRNVLKAFMTLSGAADFILFFCSMDKDKT